MSQYLETFIIAGATVTGIQYLGNSVNPLLGGILSGIPISIPSMLLINGVAKQKEFILSANIMVALLCVVTFLCWYLYDKLNYSGVTSAIVSCSIWFVCAIIYYFYIIRK